MMQTLDGKIASGIPGIEILMDFFDLYTKIEQEFSSKVWMFGRKTAEAFAVSVNTPLSLDKSINVVDNFIVKNTGDTFAIVADVHGQLRWKNNFINLSNHMSKFHLVILVSQQTPKEYLSHLQEMNISYIVSGKNEVDFEYVLKKLHDAFSIDKILLEGGGSFNGSLIAKNFIDELSLIVVPRVLNKKDAPSLFNTDRNEAITTDFQLMETKKLEKNALWLRYKKM